MAKKLSDTELEAILAQQIELAKHDRKTGGRDASREKALDYYFGNLDKYVPPEENRSKVVSRDTADTVGWLMPQIMRAFTASGRMFIAEPDGEDDLRIAENATEGLNYIFLKENGGYKLVRSATWDALVHGDAIVKTFYDKTPVYAATRYHENLSDDERAMLIGDDEALEVLAQTPPQPGDGEDPLPPDTRYELKTRRKKANGRYVVDVIPPEEFLIDADATSLEEAAFKAHWQRKTRSDLVAMGYDKDIVAAIPEAARHETPEEQARRLFMNADATDTSMQQVDYFECFVMVDVDGDGVAEMVRACYGGGKQGNLLDWEVWEDEDPFDNIPCEPIPHRWDSRSISDETIDITDVKTVLKRQLLNNTYWVNNPQHVVEGPGVSNPEALTDGQFGQPIFAKAGTTITPLAREYIGDKALLGIRHMDEELTRRTGVSNQSMALDPETLQNQSATANQNATDASRSQPEMIARDMAELGWSNVGRKLLRLMTRHKDVPKQILVKGKAVPLNPETWNPDMHVTINVGLGTGSRDRDAAMLNTVLQQQIAFTDRIGMAFPEKALDMLPYIHNTLTRFAESTGLKNPELYWPEIDQTEIEQGKAALAERQNQPPESVQIEQMKGENAKALKEVDAQVAVRQAELKAQGDVAKNEAELQADLMTADADRQNALILEQQKADHAFQLQQQQIASAEAIRVAELEWEKYKLDATHQLEREKMANAQTIAAMKPDPKPAGASADA